MLAATVALYDVHDTEAFVQATINRSRILLSHDERDELVCEGIAIMAKLADEFEPHLEGYAQAGRFSGYAAMYLPRKLGDAWHRQHAEHQLVTGEDGKRRWEYRERAVSLEAMTAEDPDRHQVLAAQEDETPLSIEGLLRERLEERMSVALQVAGLLGEGCKSADVAFILGITGDQVREAMADLEPVAVRLKALNQR